MGKSLPLVRLKSLATLILQGSELPNPRSQTLMSRIVRIYHSSIAGAHLLSCALLLGCAGSEPIPSVQEQRWILENGERVTSRCDHSGATEIVLRGADDALIATVDIHGDPAGEYTITIFDWQGQLLAKTKCLSDREADSWSSPHVRFVQNRKDAGDESVLNRQWWLNETTLLLEVTITSGPPGTLGNVSMKGPGQVRLRSEGQSAESVPPGGQQDE